MTGSPRRLSRRSLLRSALTGGSGLLAGYLVGCNSTEPGPIPTTPTAPATLPPSPSPTPLSPTPTPSQAAITLRWRALSPTGPRPSPRRDHSLVSDGQRLYLFGGRSTNALSDLWSFDPEKNAWTMLTAEGGPPARFGHNTAYDPAGRRMLVFGGQAGSGFFNDLWAWETNSSRWVQLPPGANVPAQRYGAAGALDSAGSLLITHGFTNSGRFDDTWQYDPENDRWTNVSPQGERPVERCLMRAVWDNGAGRLLMFGGQTNAAPFLGDLWEFRDGGWRELDLKPRPSPRNLYAMTFDDEERRVILFGGNTQDGPANDLWLFDAARGQWLPQSPQEEAPASRFGHDAAWLPGSRRLILFGGRTQQGETDDLWELTIPA